jgi:hypothetical protein
MRSVGVIENIQGCGAEMALFPARLGQPTSRYTKIERRKDMKRAISATAAAILSELAIGGC